MHFCTEKFYLDLSYNFSTQNFTLLKVNAKFIFFLIYSVLIYFGLVRGR